MRRRNYGMAPIRQGDEWKTTFNTPTGHYEYLVLPFGLSNATSQFQALINDVLHDLLNMFVFVYLDDIYIFPPTPEVHRCHVRQVLQSLENQLFAKAENVSYVSNSRFYEYRRSLLRLSLLGYP